MHQMINRMAMKFDSRSVNEGFARTAVAVFASQLDPTLEELGDLKTMVSEAVTNSIIHGYRESGGEVHISASLYDDRIIKIKISDHGCGIVDIEKAREPMFTTGDEERSGMGFTIMESFSDRIHIRSAVGKGTSVTLYKRIRGKSYDKRNG